MAVVSGFATLLPLFRKETADRSSTYFTELVQVKFAGPYIWCQEPCFPVGFPLHQSIDCCTLQ